MQNKVHLELKKNNYCFLIQTAFHTPNHYAQLTTLLECIHHTDSHKYVYESIVLANN